MLRNRGLDPWHTRQRFRRTERRGHIRRGCDGSARRDKIFSPVVSRPLGLLRRWVRRRRCGHRRPGLGVVVPGITFAAFGLRRRGNRVGFVTFAGWFVFLLVFAEEPWSLLRSLTPSGVVRGRGEALRVVSLNCNVGDVRAAGEVARYRPDVVLLQESPSRGEVESVARALFGAARGSSTGWTPH